MSEHSNRNLVSPPLSLRGELDIQPEEPINTYNVHVFTEVRIGVKEIKAHSPGEASKLAGALTFAKEVSGKGQDDNQGLFTAPAEWCSGAPISVLVDPVVHGYAQQKLSMHFDARGHMELSSMDALWAILGDVPTNSEDEVEHPFLHFPAGTHREEIWAWFEASNPAFSVAVAMGNPVPSYALAVIRTTNRDNCYEFVAAIEHPSNMPISIAADRLLTDWWPGETVIIDYEGEELVTLNGDEKITAVVTRVSSTDKNVFQAVQGHARTLVIK